MVKIRVVVVNDFKGIKDVVDDVVSFGDEVFGSRDFVMKLIRLDYGVSEVVFVCIDSFVNIFVDVDVFVFCEDRFDVKFVKFCKFKLES